MEPITDYHQSTQEEAIALCKKISEVCPVAGCHVALTGGALYKDGPRKDIDILFYRIRQLDTIDYTKLFEVLHELGITPYRHCGWVTKAYGPNGCYIDIFFPEDATAPRDRLSDHSGYGK